MLWLVNARGAELEDASQLVRAAASRIWERYKAKLGKMPKALAEITEKAIQEVYTLVEVAARSKSALEKLRIAFEVGENVVFGYAPESPEEADAAKILADLAKLVKQAEEELGQGLKVWGLAQQFALALIERVEGEYDRVLKAVATIEKALVPAAVSAVGVVGAVVTHDVVLSAATPIAAAIALAKAGQFAEAAKKAREAAERIYEAAREIWEAAKVALQRIYEAVVEAIARALDYVRAHWFVVAAAAAGIITYAVAQQLDFSLWQDHIAKVAVAIAGVPAFKKAVLPLGERARQVWEAAERFWKHGGGDELRALLDGLNNSGWLKRQAVDAVDAVKAAEKRMMSRAAKKGGSVDGVRRVSFTWREVALAYALAEVAYSHIAPHMPDVEAITRDIAEKLARGEAADASKYYRQFRALTERVREAEWRLRDRLWEVQLYAKELDLAEEEFDVRLEEELAWATRGELSKLGEATLADKVVAFVLGLAADSAYSRVVLGLAEKGEGPGALALTPASAYQRYVKQRGAKDEAEEEPFRAVLMKLLADLAAYDLEDVSIVPRISVSSTEDLLKAEKGELEVVAKVRTRQGVKEVRGIVEWEKMESGIVVKIEGGLLDFVKREDFVRRVKKDETATGGVVGGWLTTDAYVKGKNVRAETTSLFQAALYKASGLEGVKAESKGTVTGAGLKVEYRGSSSEWYQLYRKIAERVRALLGLIQPLTEEVKKAAEESTKKLEGAKGAVKVLVDKLLAEGRLYVSKAAGLSAKEAAEKAKKAAEDILSREAAEKIDPAEHSAYGRVFYPMVDLLLRDASEVEFAQFFTTAVFGDGTINPSYVELTLGEFGSDALPYDRFHKLALWLAVLEKYKSVFQKYGVDITPRVYIGKNAIKLRFDLKAAGLLFALGGGLVWRVYGEYLREVGRNLWDRGFIKAEKMLKTVRKAFRDVKVKWNIDESGERPVLRMRFVREVGRQEVEITNLNVYLQEAPTGNILYAEFGGARERAEALASILRAWGAEAEARPVGKLWRVDLTTGQLYAVDHPDFKAALEAFIAKAREKGLLTEEQAEKKLAKVRAGPNAVEIAGVELHVEPIWKDREKRALEKVDILYQTTDKGQFEKAAEALKAFGLVEGVDFTARWDDEGMGDILFKAGVLDKAVEALKAEGFKEGEDYTAQKAKGGGGLIRVKKPRENLKKALEALRNAGLVEGEDYTVYSSRGVIRLSVPEALWIIAWMAKNGNKEAEKVLNQLLKVADNLGIRQYFEERIRPVLAAGSKEAKGKKFTLEEKGITVEITDFKVEWVSFKDKDKPCNWPAELCRPKVTIEYVYGGGEGGFTVTWGVGEKGEVRAGVEIKTIHKAAALIAVGVQEGDEKEKERIARIAEKGGIASLTFKNLVAMAEYNKDLLEWAMRVRRRGR